MQSTQVPAKFPALWANAASLSYVQAVPTMFNGTPGAASLEFGYGPETFLPLGSGGTGPRGEFINGFNQQLTANLQWQQAGGWYRYDAVFSTAIGGYFKGALLLMATGAGFWISTAENNTVNPDTGTPAAPATGWAVLQPNTYDWAHIVNAPSFVLNSAFTGASQNLGNNGWQALPGGVLEQWCDTPVSWTANEVVTINYPEPFPSSPGQCYPPRPTVIDPSMNAGSASNFIQATLISYGLASCQVALGNNGGGARSITVHLEVRGRWA